VYGRNLFEEGKKEKELREKILLQTVLYKIANFFSIQNFLKFQHVLLLLLFAAACIELSLNNNALTFSLIMISSRYVRLLLSNQLRFCGK